MAVPLLLTRIHRLLPILRRIPTRLQELALLLALLVQRLAHLGEDLRVRPALHGQHLALVVVPEADVQRAFDAAAAGVQNGFDDGLGVEVGGLTGGGVDLSG